jgi:hypothetical protein
MLAFHNEERKYPIGQHPAASLVPAGLIVNEDELDDIQAAHEARLED